MKPLRQENQELKNEIAVLRKRLEQYEAAISPGPMKRPKDEFALPLELSDFPTYNLDTSEEGEYSKPGSLHELQASGHGGDDLFG